MDRDDVVRADAVIASLEAEAARNDAVGWRENATLFYAEARGARKLRDALLSPEEDGDE